MLSLLLHLLILLLFLKNFNEITFVPPASTEKKITLNLKQLVTPPPAPKPKPKPKTIIRPKKPQPVIAPTQPPQPVIQKKPKPKPQVEPVKKKLLDASNKGYAQKKSEENNITKTEPKKKVRKIKTKTKEVKKKVIKQKKVLKKATKPRKTKRVKKVRKSKDPLANMLMGSSSFTYTAKSTPASNAGTYGERMIKKLYGPEFNTYSPTQKKFIRNNLSTIHRITQNTLTRNGYPSIAVRTRQQGTNVVSFYLHPNGDISGLKLKTPIGYAALDQNTIDVIRIAYKNYPLPNKKTKIVFYVTYTLY